MPIASPPTQLFEFFNFSPDSRDNAALSLYNDGGGNIQRSWLNFNLSATSGKVLTADVTMTLQAGIYGDQLYGVQIGAANAAWDASTITWNNASGLTSIPRAANPNGTVGPFWGRDLDDSMAYRREIGHQRIQWNMSDQQCRKHPALLFPRGWEFSQPPNPYVYQYRRGRWRLVWQ